MGADGGGGGGRGSVWGLYVRVRVLRGARWCSEHLSLCCTAKTCTSSIVTHRQYVNVMPCRGLLAPAHTDAVCSLVPYCSMLDSFSLPHPTPPVVLPRTTSYCCTTVLPCCRAAACVQAGWGVIVSHRSAETEDNFIADFAVGLCSGQIKAGAPCRSERLAKYVDGGAGA